MKKVFISHPFSNNPTLNQKLVNKLCKKIITKDNSIIPISPLHLFSMYDSETKELRKECLKISLKLIDLSDEVYMVRYRESLELSPGQKLEYQYARKNNKTIRKYIVREDEKC